MVVVPVPVPAGTGFGPAAILAALGVDGALAWETGALGGLHALMIMAADAKTINLPSVFISDDT